MSRRVLHHLSILSEIEGIFHINHINTSKNDIFGPEVFHFTDFLRICCSRQRITTMVTLTIAEGQGSRLDSPRLAEILTDSMKIIRENSFDKSCVNNLGDFKKIEEVATQIIESHCHLCSQSIHEHKKHNTNKTIFA